METKLSDSHKIKRMRIRQEQNERINILGIRESGYNICSWHCSVQDSR